MKLPDRALNIAILSVAHRLFPAGFEVGGVERPMVIDGRMRVPRRPVDPRFGDQEVTWAYDAWCAWCDYQRLPYTVMAEHLITLYDDTPTTREWINTLGGTHAKAA